MDEAIKKGLEAAKAIHEAAEKSAGGKGGKNGKNKKNNGKKKIPEARVMIVGACIVIVVAFLYRASGCYMEEIQENENAEIVDNGITTVHFLDVGQGDSTLICGTEKNILIDAGERDQGEVVLADLKELGIKTIDCIIATHPHSDHIGGLDDVLQYAAEYDDLEVKQVIIPDIPEDDIPTTAIFTKLLDGIEANDLPVTFAEYGMTIDTGSSILTIYPPAEGENYSSLNDYSVCAHLDCGDTSFFFTGDMEFPEEEDLLEGGYLKGVNATVLKAGHHGSDTSSSEEFLSQIDPQYVVISCGAGNSYGHPNKDALTRFKEYTDEIYRTDLEGTITCTTDGRNLAWTMEGR